MRILAYLLVIVLTLPTSGPFARNNGLAWVGSSGDAHGPSLSVYVGGRKISEWNRV